MRTIRALMITACLAGVVVVSAAFMNLHNGNTMKDNDLKNGFAVVELFTSEGCSSCPPADDLVASIEKQHKDKQIYILAYHVDYWDHQGWKDTFSDAAYSKRQRKYAEWLNLRQIYTPQIVMNGKTEFVGSDQGMLLGAISSALNDTPAGTLTLKNSIVNGKISVDYEAVGADRQSELVLALVQKTGQSNVLAGENTGRKLSHVQIVRGLQVQPLSNTSGKVSMTLPRDFSASGWELIGFVQHKTNGAILSASKAGFEKDTNTAKL